MKNSFLHAERWDVQLCVKIIEQHVTFKLAIQAAKFLRQKEPSEFN